MLELCCRPTYITHMFNFLSWLFGLISIIFVIPSIIPFLGWTNWAALPFVMLGVIFGAISSSNSGRNFCLVMLVVVAIRLSIGGGFV